MVINHLNFFCVKILNFMRENWKIEYSTVANCQVFLYLMVAIGDCCIIFWQVDTRNNKGISLLIISLMMYVFTYMLAIQLII